MEETNLSGRQIVMVILAFVVVAGAMIAYVMIALPSTTDPAGSRRAAMVCGFIATLAAIWFVKLSIDAVRDKRRGISRGPAKVSGWFNVWFGVAVTLGGVVASVLTYRSAVSGGGMWTLYYGMILWGLVQSLLGVRTLMRGPTEV